MDKTTPKKKRPIVAATLFTLLLLALDQMIKTLVIAHIPLGGTIDLMPHLSLYHARNTGIAFSMLASFNDWGLIVLTLIVIAFVISMWWMAAGEKTYPAHGGYLLVLGGAFGNLVDRLRFHYVTDYILFYVGDWSFAVFNLADVFITLGALAILCHEIALMLGERRKRRV